MQDGCRRRRQRAIDMDAASTLRRFIYGSRMMQLLAVLAYGALLHSVRTSGAAFEHAHGEAFYAYLERHPRRGRGVSTRGERLHGARGGCDRGRTVVDVGGGHCALHAP